VRADSWATAFREMKTTRMLAKAMTRFMAELLSG
jgi:hypothetical protein